MGNIRNEDNLRNSFWDWEFLNDCFHPTKIKVSDIDGVVERNGNFLWIETKNLEEKLPLGQRLLLKAHYARGDCVIVVYGKTPEVVAFTVWWSKYERTAGDFPGCIVAPDDPIEAKEKLRKVVSKWFKIVNKKAS